MYRGTGSNQLVSPFSCSSRDKDCHGMLRSLLVLVFLLIGSHIFSQDISVNNHLGNWLENASWVDGSAPDTTGIDVNVEVNGLITAT